MNPSLTDRIKAKAIDFGFSSVGIARAEMLTKEGKHLCEWFSRGYHASQLWMEHTQEKRIDPSVILPQVQSIVCVALNYYSPEQHVENMQAGKISRYAWGDDYHLIMTERLEALLDFIQSEKPGIVGKCYVDTGPMMEKAWAVRAGIGWMGKHTNIITREYGSWVFLGEIILDGELSFDEPMADRCGTCTACIDACPTQALVQPYVLNSNKCISYLTIEHRGELPQEVVPQFDHWIYGCDICQDVCPWNRFQKETRESAFQPREENIAPKLIDLAEMSQEEFLRRSYRSSMKRTKRNGLVRNAHAVLESQQTSTSSTEVVRI